IASLVRDSASNKALQRRPRSEFLMNIGVPPAAPLNAALGAFPAIAEVRSGSCHELGSVRHSTLRRSLNARASAAPTICWQSPLLGSAWSRIVSWQSRACAASQPLACQDGLLGGARLRRGGEGASQGRGSARLQRAE